MRQISPWPTFIVAATSCLFCAQLAMAHPGHGGTAGNSLVGGITHPLFGADHLLAALASGLLAVRIGGRRALFLIPATFVGLMLLGGALAAWGMTMPYAEWGITLSVLVLGLAVAMTPRLPLSMAVALVGFFAICHGHAHVAEYSGQTLFAYVAGLAIGTLSLHLAAIALGLWATSLEYPRLIRVGGALIACGYLFLVVSH